MANFSLLLAGWEGTQGPPTLALDYTTVDL